MLSLDFLHYIRGNKLPYKRVNDTPLRYAGGKSLAVGFIAEHLPNNLETLISPFFGGGSFEVALAKRGGVEVVGFDIFNLLVNYWQQQIDKPEALADQLTLLTPDKETMPKSSQSSRQYGMESQHRLLIRLFGITSTTT